MLQDGCNVLTLSVKVANTSIIVIVRKLTVGPFIEADSLSDSDGPKSAMLRIHRYCCKVQTQLSHPFLPCRRLGFLSRSFALNNDELFLVALGSKTR